LTLKHWFEIFVSNMSIKFHPPEDTAHDATRQHLLEAGGEVFEEVGFQAATVREICQRAGANIAAVNYHFGDKAALYSAVLSESLRSSLEKYPADMGLRLNATPEQRLHAFVRSFLLRMLSPGRESRHAKLMAREMVAPTAALDALVKENIRPMSGLLLSIVGELLGEKADPKAVRRCAMSVVSQILFYHHCRPVISRLFPDLKLEGALIEELAEHITRFSLAALKQLAGEKPPCGQTADGPELGT
jgi:TetR/AcrR family transcriptional regulator, regulator of cefoperazone and chloramphenicol sensitivity